MNSIRAGLRAALILLLGIGTNTTLAAAPGPGGIQPFTARFSLGNGRIDVGAVDMRLQADADRWRFSSSSRATGVFALFRSDESRETSWLAADPTRIRPLEYRFEQTGSRKESVHSVFDWDQQEVRTSASNKDDSSEHPLPPDTQDRLSVVLSLVAAARGGEQRVSVDVNEKGKMKQWSFVRDGSESIKTAAGTYDAIKIVQDHSKNGRYTATWLAPALDYLPVRIDQYKKGELKVRMELRKLER